MTRRRLALGLFATPLAAPALRAQSSYPDRPVRIVVPYSAGGVADTTARIMQAKLAEHLGQTVIIENRTGASGSIAAAAVAQAPADGHTLLYEGSTYITLPLVNRNLSVDYEATLAPIGRANSQPYIIGLRAGFPANDFAGLLAEARRRPTEVTFGTPGVAHIGHFMGELIQLMGQVRMEHIPFRGGADVARELAAGRIDVGIISFSSDWLFTPAQSEELVAALLRLKREVFHCDIQSDYGHDAFLLEVESLGSLVRGFLSNQERSFRHE